jgi:hypothetical protein
MGQHTGPLPLPILCWQLAAAALLRAGGSLPLHPQYRDECAVAVGGGKCDDRSPLPPSLAPSVPLGLRGRAVRIGTPVQRASLDPADKEAVHAQLCSAELCAEEARAAYGARAWDLLCAGPPSVVDPVHGGLWGLAQPKTHWTSELGIASNAGNDTLGCFGGIGLVGLTVSSAEVFSVPNNEWTAAADVPLPTNHPMPAATQDGRVFLAVSGTACFPSPPSRRVSMLLRVHTVRCCAWVIAVVAQGGGLFPLGQPDRDTLFEYQAGTDAWAQRANMPTSRAAGASCELGGLLYFVRMMTTHILNGGQQMALGEAGKGALSAGRSLHVRRAEAGHHTEPILPATTPPTTPGVRWRR